MKRSTPLRRRTPLKRESAKHRARRAEVRPGRIEYLESHPWCVVFPKLRSQEVHEITAGPDRQEALDQPAALLAVSRPGHKVVQHEHIFRQCARKLLATPDEYDLSTINRLIAPKDHPNPPEYVTPADVVKHLRMT